MTLTFLDRPTGSGLPRYFAKTLAFASLPSVIIAVIMFLVWPKNTPPPLLSNMKSVPVFWALFIIAFPIPFIETALLVFPTVVAKNSSHPAPIAACIGSTPIILLHTLGAWQKPFIIASLFYVSAYAYIELRNSGVSAWSAYLFVFLIHTAHNSIAIIATLIGGN